MKQAPYSILGMKITERCLISNTYFFFFSYYHYVKKIWGPMQKYACIAYSVSTLWPITAKHYKHMILQAHIIFTHKVFALEVCMISMIEGARQLPDQYCTFNLNLISSFLWKFIKHGSMIQEGSSQVYAACEGGCKGLHYQIPPQWV